MKTYIKFIISLFNISFLKIFIIFFSVISISGILEEINFFKSIDVNFLYIVFLSLLNAPSVIFEILPFIFLLSTQIFFINLIDRNELEIFKYSGLNNLKIIKILGAYSFVFGLFFVVVFYNFSSVLKNSYLLIKNQYSSDNKYLAVITANGLWIKDEINNDINIINANKVYNQYLLDVSITQFDKDFEILRILQSKKVDISDFEWKIFQPIILQNNIEIKKDILLFKSNFDLKKINSLFSNLSSLSILELINLRKSYKSLNYSVVEIDSHLYKTLAYPFYLTLITIFSAIIMFNICYQKNSFFKITLGILFSVIIYYVNYFINILGVNQKIPLFLSILLPLILLTIINFTSIIKINEK